MSNLQFKNLTRGTTWPGLVFDISEDDIAVAVYNCIFDDITIGGRNGFQSHGLFGVSANKDNITFNFEGNLLKPTIDSSISGLNMGGILFNFRGITNSLYEIYNNGILIEEFSGEARIDAILEVAGNSGTTLKFRNNNVYSKESTAISLVGSSNNLDTAVFDYNNLYTTGAAFAGLPASAENNIEVDPQFVSYTDGNYDIKDSSPLHKAGVIIT
jgi:hypothetical protein